MKERLTLVDDTKLKAWTIPNWGVFRFVSVVRMSTGDDNNFLLTVGHADQKVKE